MAIESGLPQPGVQVIQQFRTVSPTIVAPTLVPCAVAPSFQVVEAMVQNAAGSEVINSEAVASAPAILIGSAAGPFSGLDTLTLQVAVDNGPVQEFTLADAEALGLTVQQVIDQLNSSFPAPSGFAGFVKTVGANTYLMLQTIAKGEGHYLKVVAGTANTILGLPSNYQIEGVSSYKQEALSIMDTELPDPRNNMAELVVQLDSIRAFVNTGKALQEMKRSESFLRGSKTVTLTSTADLTFPLNLASGSPTTLSYSNGATVNTGVVTHQFNVTHTTGAASGCAFTGPSSNIMTVTDNSAPFSKADLGRNIVIANATTSGNNGTFSILTVSTDGKSITYTNASGAAEAFATGGSPTTGTIGTTFVNMAALLRYLNGQATATVTWSNSGSKLVATPPSGVMYVYAANPGLSLPTSATLPVTSTIIAVDDGSTGTTTPLVDILSEDFTASAAAAVVTGTASVTTYTGQGKTLLLAVDGGPMQEIVFADASYSQAQVIALVNATMGSGFCSFNSNNIRFTSTQLGNDGEVKIGAGTANTDFGLTAGSTYGQAFKPKPGDYVFGGGSFIGIIVTVAYSSNTHRLKLDRKVSKSYFAASYYIQAKGITEDLPEDRPLPDMYVDANGNIHLKQDFLRDITGTAISTGRGQLIMSYKALRLDVTARATSPALLTLDSTDTLETLLSPVNAENPLALMLYFALVNAPGIEVSGLGVDEVSESEPDGSADGYSRALSFLEAKEVYALAPATQSAVVHQAFATHVTAMSEPDAKGERIAFINPAMPAEALPTLATSGADGESTVTTNVFESNLPSLSADLVAAGLAPDEGFTYADGVYLMVAGNDKRWNLASVSGTQITLRVAFSSSQNADGFYTTSNLPSNLLQTAFSIYVRGEALTLPDGSPDYAAIAAAYAALARSYANRRVYLVAPEKVGAVVDGTEQTLKGYYLCAALAGMVGQLAPQQGFTNYPITGFTRAIGSNDKFSRLQMNAAAAGGTYWVIQNVAGGPLLTRHQLSTDLTSIETRELSITKVVDFMAKMMRNGLRNFIGKFNVTQPFLDTLSTVVQGMINFGIEQGVIVGGDLNNIIQSADQPDTVLVDVTLDVPYPCNYLRLTLVI